MAKAIAAVVVLFDSGGPERLAPFGLPIRGDPLRSMFGFRSYDVPTWPGRQPGRRSTRMGTKSSLRYGDTWHLYEDVLEAEILQQEDAIHLELRGVHFTAGTSPGGRGWLDVRMSRELAVELGLIKPDPKTP